MLAMMQFFIYRNVIIAKLCSTWKILLFEVLCVVLVRVDWEVTARLGLCTSWEVIVFSCDVHRPHKNGNQIVLPFLCSNNTIVSSLSDAT